MGVSVFPLEQRDPSILVQVSDCPCPKHTGKLIEEVGAGKKGKTLNGEREKSNHLLLHINVSEHAAVSYNIARCGRMRDSGENTISSRILQ